MNNHHIKAILFDLGNVVIDFDHWIAVKRIHRFSDNDPQKIFNLFFDSELTGLFEEGRISPEDFFLKIKEFLNLRLNYAEFLPIWNEIFFVSDKNLAVYELAKSLKNHYQIALISNINILHFEYIRKNFFYLLDIFPKIVTSYECGFRKPHPKIYQLSLDYLEVKPEEVFYIDDRRELINIAKELGIKGFVFKGIEDLKENLLDSGIII
ncbi:MAG: HAD family phosphatase [Candidatus Omnitrophica bacterium]|nr:HAD family phosphatase [Candidatus Omnitrophota bacterium]